jgi:hypothetical protein
MFLAWGMKGNVYSGVQHTSESFANLHLKNIAGLKIPSKIQDIVRKIAMHGGSWRQFRCPPCPIHHSNGSFLWFDHVITIAFHFRILGTRGLDSCTLLGTSVLGFAARPLP